MMQRRTTTKTGGSTSSAQIAMNVLNLSMCLSSHDDGLLDLAEGLENVDCTLFVASSARALMMMPSSAGMIIMPRLVARHRYRSTLVVKMGTFHRAMWKAPNVMAMMKKVLRIVQFLRVSGFAITEISPIRTSRLSFKTTAVVDPASEVRRSSI